MAGSVNKVILVGNLGRDPEVRSSQDGTKIVNLSIATSERWKDRNSGEQRERTEWHRVVIFNENLARLAEQYLRKGSKGYIEGSLRTSSWEAQDGQKRYRTEVMARDMQMLDSRGSSNAAPTGFESSEPAAAAAAGGNAPTLPDDNFDDDIPF